MSETQNNIIVKGITVESITLTDLFEKNLSIPEYQRPYIWNTENIDKLLQQIQMHQDRKETDKPMFYLGSIVLHKDKDKFNIIDGQQRITTMAIISCLKKCQIGIQYDNLISQQNIKRNYEYLSKINLEKTTFAEINVTIIITESEDDAYNFFETLNTGGKRLTGIDIIKAHHLRSVKPENINKEAIAWEKEQKYTEDVIKILLKARKWNMLNKDEIVPNRRADLQAWKAIITNEFSEKTLKNIEDVAYTFWKVKHNTMEKLGTDYAIRQPVADGENFMHYFLSFVQLYKNLFINEKNNSSDYFIFNAQIIDYIDGTIDLRAMYQVALLCYASRFGLENAQKNYLWIFRFMYAPRVIQEKTVREDSVIKHNKDNKILDNILYLQTEDEVLDFLKLYVYSVNQEASPIKSRFIGRLKTTLELEIDISNFDIALIEKINSLQDPK